MIWVEQDLYTGQYYLCYVNHPGVWVVAQIYYWGDWFYFDVLEQDLCFVMFIIAFFILMAGTIYSAGPLSYNDHVKQYKINKAQQYKNFKYYIKEPLINFNGYKNVKDDFPLYEKSWFFYWRNRNDYWWYQKYIRGTWVEKVWHFSGYVEKILYKWLGW